MSRCLIATTVGCVALSLVASLRAEDETTAVFVHYMPWYASKPVSGRWGWHWTMNRFDPERVDGAGRRQIASHDEPLIGPYDSNDPHALECHTLLMKLAGVDGAIIDWYGIEKYRDYAEIHRNTQHFIRHLKRAGLRFAICYEDQTVRHMVAGGALQQRDAVPHGKKVMRWLDRRWFRDDAYVKLDGRPVLLVFGPQHFDRDQWNVLLSDLSPRPLFYALPHLSAKSGADGAFGWPPVSGGREISPTAWRQYLRSLYDRGAAGESIVSVAFPAFRDIYSEAGVGKSYGSIDARGGKTFIETLDLALQSDAPIVQIATWNDFGEGTVIEPTRALGYRYLETVQRRAKHRSSGTASFGPADLRLPVALYELRKKNPRDDTTSARLDQVAALLLKGKCGEARTILGAVSRTREQEQRADASRR